MAEDQDKMKRRQTVAFKDLFMIVYSICEENDLESSQELLDYLLENSETCAVLTEYEGGPVQ